MKKAIAVIFAVAVLVCLSVFSPQQGSLPEPTGKQPESPVVPAAVVHGSDSLPAIWHKSLLAEDEAAIYDQIEAGLRSLSDSIPVSPCDVETLSRCYEAVLDDCPDMFWIDSRYEYQMTPGGTVMTLSPEYLITSPDVVSSTLHRYENIARQIVSQLPDDDYGKAKGIYAWIAVNCRYDEGAERSQTISGVFDDGSAACAGYSRAFQYICSYAGIPCAYISGRAMADDGQGEVPHAWNCACLDGTNCYLDATWGDRDDVAPTDYSWLGLTLSDMGRTHFVDDPQSLPDADDDVYEIWTRDQTFFQEFDQDALYARLLLAVSARDETTSLRFGSEQAAQAASSWLSEDKDLARNLIRDSEGAFPDPSGRGLFGVYDETGMNAMVIIWQF